MTEAEWDACAEPQKILEFLRGKASERKLRLFLAACARDVGQFLTSPALTRGQHELADLWERYADGIVTETDVKKAFRGGMNLSLDPPLTPPWHAAKSGILEVMYWRCKRGQRECPYLCGLLRDVFGNPFRPAVLDRTARAWNDETVRNTAHVIYDYSAFQLFPLLADALEDAGCADTSILAHCRTPGEHVRGCWVVDLLLGKT